MGWIHTSSYLHLPACFYVEAQPEAAPRPEWIMWNQPLAAALNLPETPDDTLLQRLSGNQPSTETPALALAYAGHQFGHFTLLGDGRAHLLGEVEAYFPTEQGEARSGGGSETWGGKPPIKYDIQNKGSGQTPFSRRGDGKAALGPMLREYLISEAMHALGIPTTRSLAVITTGEPVFREKPLQGAILTRVAASHLRVGTFEYAATHSPEALAALTHYALKRHYPQQLEAENPALALLQQVITAQAALIARWMLVGFVHGVMNTDNMSIAGETIDYGPCAFMDAYHPDTVFSSIDNYGRYAYGQQPEVGLWNLTRLAEALLPLLHAEPPKAINLAQEALSAYMPQFQQHWLEGMRKKLGLFEAQPEDIILIESLLKVMMEEGLDYTHTFRRLADQDFTTHYPMLSEWYAAWQARLQQQRKPIKSSLCLMRAHNPAIIPRNHDVEEALTAATEAGNLEPCKALLKALQQPFKENTTTQAYLAPPPASAMPYRTFCGT